MYISESLIKLQNLLGESYFKIGDALKNLRDEVDSTLAEAETVINEFRNNLENSSEDSLSSVVLQLENKVSGAQRTHKEYTGEFLSVMSRIFNSFDVLNNMHQPIEHIIEAAEQMELLALNAMVVAIQAGNQGGGFTCITDGFQKNAKTAFHLASNLNDQRVVVSGQFNKLKNESEEVLSLQKMISSKIEGSLANDFSALKEAVNSAVDFIENILNEAHQMKPAVHSVFEGLQNQDIIRQSMDHMLLSLEELENTKNERSSNEDVYLSKKLYDLCVFVLDEIIEQLDSDEKNLLENTDKMINLLTELEEKKDQFTNDQFNKETGRINLINSLSSISSTFEGIVSESENLCSYQSEIIKNKNQLLKSFAELHEYITAFTDPISLFKNTIVLARIEIARQPVIRNVETSINDISDEVGTVSNAAREIEDIYDKFHIMNKAVDTELKKIIDENCIFAVNFKSDIMKLTDLSNQSGKIFRELLNELNFLNSSFSVIFDEIKNNIELITKSRNSLDDMRSGILKILEEVNSSYKMIGEEELTVLMGNRKIENLLNKFTIFRHKEKILNEEISEQKASESSITLF